MIGEVLKDMTSFLAVLLFLTFGFAFIFLQLRPESSFGNEMLKTYNLIYANFDENPNGAEIPYFVIFTVFVSVTLLNLLIAIMNETYGRVQEIRFYYENKTKVNLIIEAITAKRFLLKITSGIRKSSIWRKIKFGRFRNLQDVIFVKDFASRIGFLYYVEEIKKEEYEKTLENNSKSEGRRKDDDGEATEFLQNILKGELKLLKKDFEGAIEESNNNLEVERRGKEMLNYRMTRLEEKMDTVLKLLGHQGSSYKDIDHGMMKESAFKSPAKQVKEGVHHNNFVK